MTVRRPTVDHHAFRADLIALLDKYSGKLPAIEMLALSAHLVGQLAAMQDRRILNSDQVLDIISKNAQLGNREAIDNLMNPRGRS